MAKKETAPLATNGTAHNTCSNDNTVSLLSQAFLGDAYFSYQLSEVESACTAQKVAYDELLASVTGAYLMELDMDYLLGGGQLKVELLEVTNRCIGLYNDGEENPLASASDKKSERYPNAKKSSECYPTLLALKSVITGEPFQLNRKFKDARTVRFTSFMVQCVNEPPRLKDRSESMYRRLLIIPMNKRFEGHERKYIKDDYLHRKEVLEYVLSYLMYETDYYELSEPAVCVDALAEYRVDNDPVCQFVDTVMPSLAWDLVPWQFLYDLYGAWMSRNSPNGRAENLRAFKRRITELLPTLPEWSETGANGMRPGGKMDVPELMIVEYDLKKWRNQSYRGMDVNKIATPETKSKYQGLVRVSGGKVAAGAAAANGVGVTPDGINVNDSED